MPFLDIACYHVEQVTVLDKQVSFQYESLQIDINLRFPYLPMQQNDHALTHRLALQHYGQYMVIHEV